MSVDTQTFFQIILAGFVIVWAFRKTAGRVSKIGDFEYFGLSAFWGLVVLVVMEAIPTKHSDDIKNLLVNPYATGLVFSLFGGVLAGWTGFLTKHDPEISERTFWRFINKVREKFRKPVIKYYNQNDKDLTKK